MSSATTSSLPCPSDTSRTPSMLPLIAPAVGVLLIWMIVPLVMTCGSPSATTT